MRRIRNIALAALVLVPLAILLWIWLGPRPSVYYTDGISLRQNAEEAAARTVLWAPPERLASAMNEEADSFDPCFSADGHTILFVRGRPSKNADLYLMRRESAGWSAPEALAEVNTPDADELGPELSRDGRALYFSSDRDGGVGGYDIWVSVRNETGAWSAPRNLGSSVNSRFHEFDPALTPGGDRLFFSSNRPTASGEDDAGAWRATLRSDQAGKDFDIFGANAEPATAAGNVPFAAAEHVPELNTAADEGQVAVTARGDFLYLSSDREGGIGGFDIYRSRLIHGKVGEPANLGKPVNTTGDEMDPTLWMEGFGLAFSSNRDHDETDAFTLFRSLSREVESMEESHWLWSFLDRFKWLILAAAVSLILSWWLLRRYFGERGTLMQRSVAGSVVAHLVLLVLFAFWKFAEEIIILQKQSTMEISVDSDNLAEEMLALDIRESIASLPDVQVRSQPDFASPPPPDFQPPEAIDLPPTPNIEPAAAASEFQVSAEVPDPRQLESEPSPTPLPDATASAMATAALEFDMPALQLETQEVKDVPTEEPLKAIADQSPKTAKQSRASPEPSEPGSSRPVSTPAEASAPSAPGEPSSALTSKTAETGEVAPPASPVPVLSMNITADVAKGPVFESDAIRLEEAPQTPVIKSGELETGEPSPTAAANRRNTVPTDFPSGAPRAATHPAEPTQRQVRSNPSQTALTAAAAAAPVPMSNLDALEFSPLLGMEDLDVAETIVLEAPVEVVDPYLLRNPEMRDRVIEHIGGSEETQRAIRSALDWFTRHQEPDGRWDIRRFGGRAGHNVASTSFAILCYMGWGSTHLKDTPHRQTVRKAIDWLLAQIKEEDGDARGKGGDMYDHGIATIALAECYALTKDKAILAKLEKAVEFIVEAQSPKNGGWRYRPGEHAGDTSVVGWQVLALRSARMAGLEVPESAFDGARRWLDHVGGGPHRGLYGYQNRQPKPAMVAEGMFCHWPNASSN